MGWERRRGRDYFYLKERNGERVASRYIGRGPVAELSATVLEVARCRKLWARRGHQQFVREMTSVDKALDVLETAVRELRDLTLISLGYHQHKGQWRHSRAAELPSGPDDEVTS